MRPTYRDFDTQIISRHPENDGQKLRHWTIDGIKTIGVLDNEPFEIWFHNRSREDVSVRASVDGVDTMNAKPASLATDGMMWFVRAGSTLHLKAWHESSDGGSRLVFTSKDKSVAAHTSGDTSHVGIIALAVFMERDAPAYISRTEPQWRSGYFQGSIGDYTKGGAVRHAKSASTYSGTYSADSVVFNNAADDSDTKMSLGDVDVGPSRATRDSTDTGPIPCAAGPAAASSLSVDLERTISDEQQSSGSIITKQAAVGAGEYTEQKTRTVTGLTHPTLNSILRVKYVFWSELKEKLGVYRPEDKYASLGFPAEPQKTFADLSNVPRIASEALIRTYNS